MPQTLPTLLAALWQFSRPHTIYGTTASVVGLSVLALGRLDPSLGLALVAALLANVYIVGLNQLTDVAIDRINKPELPLAAGTLTLRQGKQVVIFCGVSSVLLAMWQPWLLLTVLLCLAIGTAYSLPPLRLKRFPLWAAFCIYGVRGLIVNIGFFVYFRDQAGQPLELTGALWGLVVFVLIFTLVIALFKDIPDIAGDRAHGISTFSVRWGELRVYHLCIAILVGLYLGVAIVAGAWGLWGLALAHGLGGLSILWAQRQLKEAKKVYQFIWKLFYLEYLVYPLALLHTFGAVS